MPTGPGVRFKMLKSPEYKEICLECIMSMPRKEYSLFVSNVMNHQGYSYEMVKLRQQIYKERDNIMNMKVDGSTQVTTGGKGEGTAILFESDIDFMFVLKDVICCDNPQLFLHREHITLFQIETRATSPGYTKLKLLKCEGVTPCTKEIMSSLFESEDGSYYISSSSFMNNFHNMQTYNIKMTEFRKQPISGPSTPASDGYIFVDKVISFRFLCPDILESWIARPRHHEWPSLDTIHYISQLDGHVVPVGSKVSEEMSLEWRICFSLAEKYLISNLNETQLKLYILLKKIAKTLLKKVCKNVTSYIMKNVVLWICELNNVDKFKPELLMDRMVDCLVFLRTCISRGNLPSYMISERNLLNRRISIQQRIDLTKLLSDLLKEGGSLLLRCTKIRDCLLVFYTCPAEYRELGERKEKVEILELESNHILMETILMNPNLSSEELGQLLASNQKVRDIQRHIKHLILFDNRALIQSGHTVDEIKDMWRQQLHRLLS